MNPAYEISGGYQLNPKASYSTPLQSSYAGVSPAYQNAIREYQKLSYQMTQKMRGSYGKH